MQGVMSMHDSQLLSYYVHHFQMIILSASTMYVKPSESFLHKQLHINALNSHIFNHLCS